MRCQNGLSSSWRWCSVAGSTCGLRCLIDSDEPAASLATGVRSPMVFKVSIDGPEISITRRPSVGKQQPAMRFQVLEDHRTERALIERRDVSGALDRP